MRDWKQLIRDRLASLDLHPSRVEEIAEELSGDLEERYRRALDAGMPMEEAESKVLRELGSTGDIERRIVELERWVARPPAQDWGRPHSNKVEGWPMASHLWQDLRYGFRILGKSPWFTLVAVMTLALGIGANTAVFSVVYGVLLKPLPFAEPDQLVWFWGVFSGGRFASTSPPDFLDYRSESKSFASLSASIGGTGSIPATLSSPEGVIRIRTSVVTAGFFETLGVPPALGRTFNFAEERVGADGVVILSHGFWQRIFGGDPQVLGRELIIDRKPTVVIGVMPPSFNFPQGAELWRPLAFGSEDSSVRRFHFLRPVGRLKEGVTRQQAEAELNRIAMQLEKTYPASNTTWRLRLEPLLEVLVGDIRTTLWVMLTAVTLVMLIACVNVANLLLARGTERQREMAIRLALGASRGRVISQLLAESFWLALGAGVLGFALAYGATRWLQSLGTNVLARQSEIGLEPWMLAFTLGCSALTGMIFGLAPVAQVMRRDSAEVLHAGGRSGASSGTTRLRSALMVVEFALSLVLLVGAGLLARTFWNLAHVDLGFSRENLLVTNLGLDEQRYTDEGAYRQFFHQLFTRLRTIPGVVAAGGINLRPLQGFTDIYFTIHGRPPLPKGQTIQAQNRIVTRDYFRTVGVRILAGRVFSEQDSATSPAVVVVNQAFVDKFLPEEDPIGKVLVIDRGTPRPSEIIGVVAGARQVTTQDPHPEMYGLFDQFPLSALDILIRTQGDPAVVIPFARSAATELDRMLAFASFRRMEEVADSAILQDKLKATLMVGFAGVALVLAAVGIAGMVAQAVSQRTKEIGLRMALGANPGSVVRLILGQGMKLVFLGAGIGLLGALALARTMQTMLYDVTPSDPVTLVAVSGFLLVIAAVACWIPAVRAAKVDPVVALRRE